MKQTVGINANQHSCLLHYEYMEVEHGGVVNPTGFPNWNSYWTCHRKGLIGRNSKGRLTLTDLGRDALISYPQPVEVTA